MNSALTASNPDTVTIAIPCFNAEHSIRTCVASALAQTWSMKEIIVVNDGSTDGSLAVLEEFGAAICVVSGEHRGGNAARNQAMERAGGAWMQFLDADDFLEPAKIKTQLEESANGQNADVIYSPVWIETPFAETIDRRLGDIAIDADIYAQWLGWRLPQTGGGLWRTSAIRGLGGWLENQPCCQEHELYWRAIQADLRFVFASTPGAVYRIWSDDTLCRRDPLQLIREKTRLLDAAHEWMRERRLWNQEHERIAGRACFEMARTIARHDLAAARDYLRERAERGLLHLDGPAAPLTYRLFYKTLGFRAAETFASWGRQLRT